MNDLRFSIRQLLRNPGFTGVAVLTLALCLGANLTIFAVVDAILLRPLPFPDSERLVTLFNSYPKSDLGRAGVSTPDLYTRLGGVFASVALLLAAIGTYGVLSFSVAQQRREIGVRMALGALPGQIGRQFLSLGLRLLAIGTFLGMSGAWLAGHVMQSILFDVPSLHFATLAGTTLLLGAVALIAGLLPALRASRIHPMEALGE